MAFRFEDRGGVSSRIMITGSEVLAFRSCGASTGSSLIVDWEGSVGALATGTTGASAGSPLIVGRFASMAVETLVFGLSFLSSGGISPFAQNLQRCCSY